MRIVAAKTAAAAGMPSGKPQTRAHGPRPTDAASGAVAAADAKAELPSVAFAALAAGRPLLGGLSVRYLREVGMFVYEDTSGNVRAALAKKDLLPLIDTIEWTLRRARDGGVGQP